MNFAIPGIELHFLGGRALKASQVTVGVELYEALGQIRPDLCFIGVRSLHPELGLTTLDAEEARIKSRMVAVSERAVVLATNDKLGAADHYRICDAAEIHTLLVEGDAPEEELRPFRELGVRLI